MATVVYKLDKNDAATDMSAQSLADSKWSADVNEVNQVQDFAESPVVPPHQLSRMVFIGHANTKTIGKYTATEFVRGLCRIVPDKKNKKAVKDIYLIGCEVGKITKKGCLAQNIANELKEAEFENVRVHAIASPEVLSAEEHMVVSVLNKPGAAFNLSKGSLNAHVMNQENAERSDQLEKQIASADEITARNAQRELNDIQQRSRKLIKYNSAKKELDKQQHIFIPGESLEYHLKRMKKDADYIIDNQDKYSAKVIVLAFIAKRIQQHELKSHHDRDIVQILNPFDQNPKKLIKKLNSLFDKIQDADDAKWKKVLHKNMGKFKIFEILPNDTSSTYMLLEALDKGNFNDACSLIDYSDSNERRRQIEQFNNHDKRSVPQPEVVSPQLVSVSSCSSSSPAVAPAPVKGSVTETTPPPSRSTSPDHRDSGKSENAGQKFTSEAAQAKWEELRRNKRSAENAKEPLVQEDKFSALSARQKYAYALTCRNALKEYVRMLNEEIDHRWFSSWLYPNTKDKKKNKCEELSNIVNPDTFFAAVHATLEKGGTVTCGVFSDRAYTLLTNILAVNVNANNLRGAILSKPETDSNDSKKDSRSCCF